MRYLVSASLKTQTRGTLLGHVWWVLDPLLLMGVYVLVVHVLLDRGGPNYPVFVFVAVLSWKWFTSGVQRAVGLTIGKEQLMKRVAFPRSALPISAVIASTIHFGFGLLVLLVFAAALDIYPHPALLLLPLVAAVQFVLTLSAALFFSALNVFFRDIAQLLTYIFRLGFYISPGLYAVSKVPDQYLPLYKLNPFATLFPAYQTIVIAHSPPDFPGLTIVAFGSAALLFFTWLLFVKLGPYFTKVA